MRVSQHSPFALQKMKSATHYMNTQVGRYGDGLNIKLDAQSGKPTILVKNNEGETIKRFNGAMVQWSPIK